MSTSLQHPESEKRLYSLIHILTTSRIREQTVLPNIHILTTSRIREQTVLPDIHILTTSRIREQTVLPDNSPERKTRKSYCKRKKVKLKIVMVKQKHSLISLQSRIKMSPQFENKWISLRKILVPYASITLA